VPSERKLNAELNIATTIPVVTSIQEELVSRFTAVLTPTKKIGDSLTVMGGKPMNKKRSVGSPQNADFTKLGTQRGYA
jgi:hypothetical protein